ncbi:polypeptide N-acetylgalactosaminyltransferase 9 isoform X4 [Ictidomys tridecemlineatus]
MAVARKIKTLLTVNILVFVGIVLFSVYCRLQDRSAALVQVVRGADRRVRSRHAKVGALADREAILQRLDHLEEVVYNQLNGLAKPIGLVEGPGGLGQGGVAATLQEDSQEREGKYEEYGYNAQLSDRISLDRTIPDYRPKKCRQLTYSGDLPQVSVVFIFVNEALSVILRSVHSVVNHTPSQLLKEVILVDDNSDNVELKFNLDQYVHRRYPGLVKVVRNSRREGLIRARLQGWKVATAPVVGFFDAHVEFNTGWAEPALLRIREDRRRIVLPAIDNIKYSTFEVQQYASAAHGYNWGLWCMYIIPPQDWLDRGDEAAPIRVPPLRTVRNQPGGPAPRPVLDGPMRTAKFPLSLKANRSDTEDLRAASRRRAQGGTGGTQARPWGLCTPEHRQEGQPSLPVGRSRAWPGVLDGGWACLGLLLKQLPHDADAGQPSSGPAGLSMEHEAGPRLACGMTANLRPQDSSPGRWDPSPSLQLQSEVDFGVGTPTCLWV